MGWYHSHPFEVGQYSNCYMSQTDMSTQIQWQRSEDPHGNPFLAIVLDPLRSLVKGNPELKAFRAYPPEWTNPVANQCPDGTIVHEEQNKLEKWGSCWPSYYELDVEYYMSGSARNVLSLLTQNFLWMRTLGSTPMCETEARGMFPDRVGKAAELLAKCQTSHGGGSMDLPSALLSSVSRGSGGRGAPSGSVEDEAKAAGKPTSSGRKDEEDGGELSKACQAVVEIATEKLVGNIAQISKKELFSG